MTSPVPRLRKQWVAVIDPRTTSVCLHAAGQIREITEAFDTLTGHHHHPPAHVNCRAVAVPRIEGLIEAQQRDAAAERARREVAGDVAERVPPPAPTSQLPRTLRLPGRSELSWPRSRAEPAVAVWLPHVARMKRAAPTRDRDGDGAPVLEHVQRVQGFDGPARVVSPTAIARMVADRGARRVWLPTADEVDTDTVAGGVLTVRPGVLGAGVWLAADPDDAAAFTGDTGTVVPAALDPDARIIDWDELDELRKHTLNALTPARRRRLAIVLDDPGVFAAAMGYDAVLLPGGDLLLLNPTRLHLVSP